MITATPEPQAYIDAQIAALMDPTSARDTVLVTPGSPMPSFVPPGLTIANTSRGIVITKDPRKVGEIDKGGEAEVGNALFGFYHDQREGGDMAAVAHDAMGTPVAELATPQQKVMQALQAASLLAPADGSVSLMSKQDAATKRILGLLGA